MLGCGVACGQFVYKGKSQQEVLRRGKCKRLTNFRDVGGHISFECGEYTHDGEGITLDYHVLGGQERSRTRKLQEAKGGIGEENGEGGEKHYWERAKGASLLSVYR